MADINYLDKVHTAELIDEIKRRLGSKADQVFTGTEEEWNGLTSEQQAAYQVLYITNDIATSGSGKPVNIFSQAGEPVALDEEFSEGDFLAINDGNWVYSSLYTYNDGEWVECDLLGYGNAPGAPSSDKLGKYFIATGMVSATQTGEAQVVLQCQEREYNSNLMLTWYTVGEKTLTGVDERTKLHEAPSIPVSEINENDLWAQTDVDGNIEALYRYEVDPEDDTKYIWNKLCDVGHSTSAVGENVGNHNERFNDYSNNTIGGGDYNHVEGHDNTVFGTNMHVEGSQNRVTNGSSTWNFVGGYDNMITAAIYGSIIYGNANKFQNYSGTFTDSWVLGNNITFSAASVQITYSGITGYGHTISTVLNQSYIFGSRHNISKSMLNSIVAGCRNTISGSSSSVNDGSIIAGCENTLSSDVSASLVVGRYHIFSSPVQQSILCGDHHTGHAYYALVCGSYANVEGKHRICVGNGTSAASRNVFTVEDTGTVNAKQYDTTGADYAEYFEWLDGNTENEDRRGMLVALDGDKILPANGDGIFGIISAAPSVVGNAEPFGWRGKYKRDIFRAIICDDGGNPVLSEDFDNETEYIPRSERPEWAPVGFVGRLIVADDGSCLPNRYCAAENGVAVLSIKETRVRTLKRIDETHIEVLIR